MFRYPSLIFTLLFAFGSFSQQSFAEKKPIHVSYLGHLVFHPGFKIGTQYDFRTWTKSKEKKKGEKVKNKSLFVSPQIGLYTHPQNHTGLLVNADVGYQRVKPKRGFYSAYSLGVGYLAQFNAGITYDFNNDGSIDEKRFASRSYFFPSVNAEFGQQINEQIGWFSKITFGMQLPYNSGAILVPLTELGVKLNLGRIKNKS